jgi:hypothetical protein
VDELTFGILTTARDLWPPGLIRNELGVFYVPERLVLFLQRGLLALGYCKKTPRFGALNENPLAETNYLKRTTSYVSPCGDGRETETIRNTVHV